MKPEPPLQTGSMRGPVPAQAGANLLVHDLKNLAGRLATLWQNLDERYDDPLFKKTALELLDDTVLHLKRLASDLRDHEGRVVIKLRVNVNEVAAEAILDTRPDLRRDIKVDIGFAEMPSVWGDAYLLRLAFACAIENSLEAMGEKGGILTVRTSLVRGARRPSIVFEVCDTGPGMSEEFLKHRLFRPFSTTKTGGLGLGVYTIRQVASLHGGSVRISSVEGLGTRFRLRLPIEEA